MKLLQLNIPSKYHGPRCTFNGAMDWSEDTLENDSPYDGWDILDQGTPFFLTIRMKGI